MDPKHFDDVRSMRHHKEADKVDTLEDPNAFSALHISLMTVGAVAAFTLVAFLFVLYKKMRKPKYIETHSFTPTVVINGGRDFGSKENALLNNKSHRDSDIPRILTFIPMDVYVDHSKDNNLSCDFMPEPGLDSLSASQTTFTGKENPFSCQFSDFVTSEGGEVLSPSSDVSVTIPRNSIPVGRIQQVFVNVTEDIRSAFHFEGQMCATPLVECLAPGLKSLSVPLILRLPLCHDARNIRVYWSQSLDERDVSWLTIPREHVDCHVQQLMSYTVDAGFLCIKTYHMESFTCYASVQ